MNYTHTIALSLVSFQCHCGKRFYSAKTPKFRCKDCSRQFVEHPIQSRISDAEKTLIDNMLLEKIPLAGIARVTGISERWLQDYTNEKYGSLGT